MDIIFKSISTVFNRISSRCVYPFFPLYQRIFFWKLSAPIFVFIRMCFIILALVSWNWCLMIALKGVQIYLVQFRYDLTLNASYKSVCIGIGRGFHLMHHVITAEIRAVKISTDMISTDILRSEYTCLLDSVFITVSSMWRRQGSVPYRCCVSLGFERCNFLKLFYLLPSWHEIGWYCPDEDFSLYGRIF